VFVNIAIKVLISSPSGVEKEVDAIIETIHRWNSLHSENKKTIFLPIHWESHSRASMRAKAQDTLNQQIVDPSDIIIACIGTRIGTPTDNAESGTVEEIDRFIKDEKPVMLVFSNIEANPNNIDPEQLKRRQEQKAKYFETGLAVQIDSLEALKQSVDAYLTRVLDDSKLFERIMELVSLAGEAFEVDPESLNKEINQGSSQEDNIEKLHKAFFKACIVWKATWDSMLEPYSKTEVHDLLQNMASHLSSTIGDIAEIYGYHYSHISGLLQEKLKQVKKIKGLPWYSVGNSSTNSTTKAVNELIEELMYLAEMDWNAF